jgi:hypothetical protein
MADLHWFQSISGVMIRYASYWKNSSDLGKLSVEDGNSILIIAHGTQVMPNRNAHRDFAAPYVRPNAIYASVEPTFPSLIQKHAALTQLNWQPQLNYCHGNDQPGSIGQTRLGPYWNVRPDVYNSVEFDPTTNIAQTLATHMALSRPANPRTT